MSEAPLADQVWLRAPESVALLNALVGDGFETRFVGGVVRDALAGRAIADIDLATTMAPAETMRRLRAAGIKVVPTGLAHGTVTAVLGGHGYEITTLRQDVATDGRHAEVAFTQDWRADAARRDFTMNAMSADRAGRVYDYFGGRDDLAVGRVRFVGEPMRRVEEDFLRILRFFRFHAWYGAGLIDHAGLEACRAGVAGLARVSAERIRSELLRLLAAPAPGAALAAMATSGVLTALLGVVGGPIDGLLALEASVGRAPDPLLRLAALLPGDGAERAESLRLSRAERAALEALAPPWTDLGQDVAAWRRSLHRLGPEAFARRALLAATAGEADMLAARLGAAADWRPRQLPLKGRDLIALGAHAGPEIGALIAALESYWIACDFAPDRATLLAEAKGRLDAEKARE